jgi:hypothetical protein
MANPPFGDPPDCDRSPERDVIAMLAMLDYLITEVGRIDELGAQCLALARQSLSEAATGAVPKPH